MKTSIASRANDRKVIVGVDTHKYVHVAVAIDTWGSHLEARTFAADSGGYAQLLDWARSLGRIDAFGIEGTGSYGVGLASAARRAGHRVVEVNRGDRRSRRANGKSDTVDAEAAARSVLSGQSTATPAGYRALLAWLQTFGRSPRLVWSPRRVRRRADAVPARRRRHGDRGQPAAPAHA